MIIDKKLEDIEETDLQVLIENKVREGREIEYKEALTIHTDEQKQEFLNDVSSFANAIGGHLIYGIRESKVDAGIPVELCGLKGENPGKKIVDMENILRTGLAPRLHGVYMKPISLSNQAIAIVIYIQKSFASPHMVKSSGRFYTRNSVGKEALDVYALRTAFELSGTIVERIRNFRADRLSKIIAGDTPAPLDEKAPKLILHIVPFSAFDPATAFNIALLTQNNNPSLIVPLMLRSGGYRYPQYNFDGLLSVGVPLSTSYTQIFRNGIIESVDTTVLGASREERITTGNIYEGKILEALKRYLEAQRRFGVEPPFFIMGSLLGVKGYHIGFENYDTWGLEDHRIDRPNLIVPEVMIDSFDSTLTEVMKPIFDTIANAASWPRSMTYDEDGKSLLRM